MKSGMNYAPESKEDRVVERGAFQFAVTALDHGHIYGMCNGLIAAGAELKWVYEPNDERRNAFLEKFPECQVADSLDVLLQDEEINLIAGAGIPNERADLGIQVMKAGKNYFSDKPAATTLDQIARVKETIAETNKKFMVYYSERLHVEAAVYAGQLIEEGAIGRVLQVIGLGPHRIGAEDSRPDWFYDAERCGGILCDIGSHQIEQFLYYSGAKSAQVTKSQLANFHHKKHDAFYDFGDAMLLADNGATMYFRVDWFTPDGLSTWGDGRTMILGTEGYIEMRKYVDVARDKEGNQLYLVNAEGEQHFSLSGKVGYPFFGALILDCINGTEEAMTQEHALLAAELCILAQQNAEIIES